MSWGTELWDQYDNLATHTQKGIDFLEKYGNFVRDRCTIEMEYAGKLKRLVKNYQPKRKEEDDYQYTPCKAFRLLLDELSDLAGQREVVAENLQANVLRELHLLAKELRDERKKHLSDGAKQTATLAASAAALDRARRSYERAAREAERALDAYQRADADLNLSRAEVEKQRAHMAARAQQAEDARADYAAQRNKTNEMQRAHYGQMMPQVFKMLQDLDEKRIKNIKNFMLSSVVIERNVFPIISKCLDGMDAAANCINEKEDTSLVIERYKSGFLPPADYPLEEAGRGADSADGAAQTGAPLTAYHATAPRGTISGGKIKKRVGLLSIFSSNKNNISTDGKEDYSDLPPNQRRKKLAAKVQELRKQVAQEQAVMDGLMKMKGVYEANSALGDPMTVEGQLNECGHKLEKLKAALGKFQGWLEAAGTSAPQPCAAPAPVNHGVNGGGHRHSIGSNSESLSRSASDSSVSTAGAPSTQPANGDCETGEGVEAQPEYYYEPELQPLGMCKALYPFEATSAGSMRMSCGESLLVVERDQGDGWTRVRRAHTHEEGFVPTTYISTTLFGDTG